jgi:MYXO-CTERM domain-containing protein
VGFDVVYTPKSVVLVARPAYTADFDDDGDVDGGDLAEWQGDFGVNAFSDANDDGDSDGHDFLAWQRQLGSGAPAAIVADVVPEPSGAALALMILGGATMMIRRRLLVQHRSHSRRVEAPCQAD